MHSPVRVVFGTVSVILALAFVYFIRSPLTGLHADTRPHYATTVDVGMTDTRIHLFKWRGFASYHSFEILAEYSTTIPKGYSSGIDSRQLRTITEPAMEFISAKVPKQFLKDTNILVFFNTPSSVPLTDHPRIQKQFTDAIGTAYGIVKITFDLPSDERCRFAWEAASYLLHHDDVMQPHIGVIDLGENNMHIAFYSPEEEQVLVESHKQMGLFSARKKFFDHGKSDRISACESKNKNAWEGCVQAVERVFMLGGADAADGDCADGTEDDRCRLSSLVLPSLKTTKFVSLRLFYSMMAIAGVEGHHVSLEQLAAIGERFCKVQSHTNTSVEPAAVGGKELVWAEIDLSTVAVETQSEQKAVLHHSVDLNSTACFDFAYLTTLLHHGFGFPMTEEAFLFKDDSGNTVGKRSSIWLLGALIAGTRVDEVSAQTMGIDPGHTGFYIAGLHLSLLVAVYFLIKQGVTVSLLKLPVLPARRSFTSAPIIDDSPAVLPDHIQHVAAADLQSPDQDAMHIALQRSRSGERINTAALHSTNEATEVTLLRSESVGQNMDLSTGPLSNHQRTGSGDSTHSSDGTTSRRVSINLSKTLSATNLRTPRHSQHDAPAGNNTADDDY